MVTKDLVEIEHDMHVATKAAIDNYKKATTASNNYNKALYKVGHFGILLKCDIRLSICAINL